MHAILSACQTLREVVFGVHNIFLFTPVPYNKQVDKGFFTESGKSDEKCPCSLRVRDIRCCAVKRIIR